MTYGRAGSSPAFGTKSKTAFGRFFIAFYLSVSMDKTAADRLEYPDFSAIAAKQSNSYKSGRECRDFSAF